jgi:hypothetical protein
MKNIILILIAALLFSSCGKKEGQSSTDELKKKELELKEKQLDSLENEIKKDSINNLNKFSWEGDYNYVIKGERGHEWHYDLKIKKEQNGYTAIFDVFGFQMAYPMNGSVVIEGNKAKIYFEKFHDEPMINDFKKGDLLVELENTGTDILTYWHKAMILDNVKSGVAALKKVKGDSFTFMNKDIIFGSSLENFLGLYTEFKLNNELKSGDVAGATYTSRPKGCEINYNVYFDKTGLFKFEMKSNCSSGQDEKIIKIITSQFKYIPSKNTDDDEIGDIVETYNKGKLTATAFIGGFYMLTIERKK